MLLGIGLVFLAMGIIGSPGTAAATNSDLKVLFGVVDHYPLVVFIGTALLTVALQSSTASIGLGIGLAESGLLPGTTIVPWVLGARFRRSRKARLEKPLSVQSASSNVVDMINCLRWINSQLTSLAYAIVRDSTRSGETTGHSPELEEAWQAEDSAKPEAKQPAIKDS